MLALCAATTTAQEAEPLFDYVNQDLFAAGRSLTNAIADFDNDGDLDIFVGFNGQPNRLYRNDDGVFVDVAEQVGIADNDLTRTAAWGDFNGDGHLDLFVGFAPRENAFNRLYRNDGDGAHFTDVSAEVGVTLSGSFRQASWIDFDADGDTDLFVALRNFPNVLLRNDEGHFTDVAEELGVADSRRTVGAAWFDYDKDGDLDLIVANMDGDANGLFRNDGSRFVDVATEAGLADGGRLLGEPANGTVRPTIVDFDNDGNLDVFMANYGPNGLFRNLGNGRFENVAERLGLAIDGRYDMSTWGDFDNDGRIDTYVNGTITGGVSYRDYLFQNKENGFVDVTPDMLREQEADHGAHWFDFNDDGNLDLALTGAAETGMHHVFRNTLTGPSSGRALKILVLDQRSRYMMAGAEVRLYDSETRTLLGTRLLDTGSGYNSQNAMPVHFGLAKTGLVDIEVTILTGTGRAIKRVQHVDPKDYFGRVFKLAIADR